MASKAAIVHESNTDCVVHVVCSFLCRNEELQVEKCEFWSSLEMIYLRIAWLYIQDDINEILQALRDENVAGDQILRISMAPTEDFQRLFQNFIEVLDNRMSTNLDGKYVKAGFALKLRALLENLRVSDNSYPNESRAQKRIAANPGSRMLTITRSPILTTPVQSPQTRFSENRHLFPKALHLLDPRKGTRSGPQKRYRLANLHPRARTLRVGSGAQKEELERLYQQNVPLKCAPPPIAARDIEHATRAPGSRGLRPR